MDTIEASGVNFQGAPSDPPIELISPRCSGDFDIDYIAILRDGDVNPDGADMIQIMGNNARMAEWTNTSSASGPGADLNNPGAVSVGALSAPGSTNLATYSSRGPTTDGRVAPQIAAPSCLPVIGFSGCFHGTSSSAPLFSGIVALLRESGVVEVPADLADALPDLTVDLGVPGPDVDFGLGGLDLPAPSHFFPVETPEAPVLPFVDEQASPPAPPIAPEVPDTPAPDTTEVPEVPEVPGTPEVPEVPGTPDTADDAGVVAPALAPLDATTLCFGQLPTIVGTNGNDVLTGTDGPDVILAGDGDDTIEGGRGDDLICSGCLLYTSPSPRDLSTSRMPSSA